MESAPLSTRLLLSFGVATFIAALASVWVLADVRRRVERIEADRSETARGGAQVPEPRPAATPPGRPAREPGVFPAPKEPPKEGEDGPLETTDPLKKLDYLIKTQQEQGDSHYDYYSDMMGDLVAIKREIRQLKATIRNLSKAVQQGQPGGLSLGWGLAPRGQPIGAEVAKAYAADAQRFGIQVEPGRVTARALLNLSPNKQMPIEYFITRFPESGHETLVHLIGAGALPPVEPPQAGSKPAGSEPQGPNPLKDLAGLGTALYKALVAAGFKEGEGSHLDEPAGARPRPGGGQGEGEEEGEGALAGGAGGAGGEPAPAPKLVLPTGDVIYVYVRYTLDGATHVARATDWVLDPSTGKALPEDCFRFTGSLRVPDPETGEEMLAAELGGLLVSVWPNASALLEVALDSSVHNDYQYNSTRIPKPAAAGPDQPAEPLLLDLILSATPIEVQGDGARPHAPAPPREPEGPR